MQEITVYDAHDNPITSLVQWDNDVYVHIKEDTITSPYELHFFNVNSKESYVVESTYDGGVLKAKIPNILLTEPFAIVGFINAEKEDGIKCEYRFRINIIGKPKPSNVVHVDTNDYLNATKYAEEVRKYKEESEKWKKYSESYAHGGTDYADRDGVEDTDNAKYYCDTAKKNIEEAFAEAESSLDAEIAKANDAIDRANEALETASQVKNDAENANQEAAEHEQAAEAANQQAAAHEQAAKDAQAASEAAKNEADKSAENAAASAEAASKAKDAAETSKTAAADSAASAATSQQEAAKSAGEAAASQEKAAASQTAAETATENAGKSEASAKAAQSAAEDAQSGAQTSAAAAEAAKNEAAASNKAAGESAGKAAASATDAENWAKRSESFAHGTTEIRDEEATDNAQYYYEQSKQIAQGLEGALVPVGTIQFSDLATKDKVPGFMYNVSDAFTSTEDFEDGGGRYYGAGSNVYCTADMKWDVMAAITVTGVKGSAEEVYHQGNVSLSADNVGAAAKSHTHTVDEVTGVLPVSKGGTSQTSIPATLKSYFPNNLTEGTRNFAVLGDNWDKDGWVSPSQALGLIGAAAATHNHDSAYVKKAGDTMTGALTTPGLTVSGVDYTITTEQYETLMSLLGGVTAKLIDWIYPVGSVIASTKATFDPVALYGGKWERFAEGQTLVGVKDGDADFGAGKSGGSKNSIIVSHTHSSTGLSISAVAAHSHSISVSGTTQGGGAHTPSGSVSVTEAGAHTHGTGHSYNNFLAFKGDIAVNPTARAYPSASSGGRYFVVGRTASTQGGGFTATGSAGGHGHTTTLTMSAVAAHTHDLGTNAKISADNAGDHSHTISGSVSTAGSDGTNANLQPYTTVYYWQRTA